MTSRCFIFIVIFTNTVSEHTTFIKQKTVMILYPVINVFYPSGDICRSGYKIITAADVLHILFYLRSILYCITFSVLLLCIIWIFILLEWNCQIWWFGNFPLHAPAPPEILSSMLHFPPDTISDISDRKSGHYTCDYRQ